MKNIHLYVWGLLMLLMSCTPENRVIDKPVSLASNTTSIEVSKVALTDSNTVVSVHAWQHPGWWINLTSTSILTDDKGNVYPIQGSEGIKIDEKFWMSESGETEFRMIFPPLKRGAKYVDFSEGPEVEGGWQIWGIQLKNNQLPELRLPKGFKEAEVDKSAPLPEVKLTYGQATIKGHVLGYREGMPRTINVMVYSVLDGYTRGATEVELASDGSFTHTVDILGTASAAVFYAGCPANFYVAPGEVSEVCVNLRELSRKKSKLQAEGESYGKPVYYNGPLPALVAEWEESNQLINYGRSLTDEELLNTSLEDYKKFEMTVAEEQKQAVRESSLSEATKTYALGALSARLVVSLQQAPSRIFGAYYQSKGDKLDRNEANAYYQKLMKSVPADYTSDLMSLLDDPV
ncbi:MAG: hypothetical protein IJ456_02270, partial [Bacteroides sp.]|nr:hypothetical protein [Bacteroides sp.]